MEAATVEGTRASIEQFKVKEGFNPRDELGDLTELEQSIEQMGILVPLLVVEHDDGLLVIDGHRRLQAAANVGVKALPYVIDEAVDEDDRLARATVTSVQREGLTPLQEARAIERLGFDEKKAMEVFGKSRGWVKTRIAMLGLPDDLQAKMDAGKIPLGVVERLSQLPHSLQRAIDHYLENRGEEDGFDWGDLMKDPLYLVRIAVVDSDYDEGELSYAIASTAIGYEVEQFGHVIEPELRDRALAAGIGGFHFGAEETVDAARAFGALIELEGDADWAAPLVIITDTEFIVDRIKLMVEGREETKDEEQAEATEREELEQKVAQDPEDLEARQALAEKREKEAKRVERELEKERRRVEHAANLEFGVKLYKDILGKEMTRPQALVIAGALIDELEPRTVGMRGLRYIEPKLQKVEVKKSGESVVRYWPEGFEAEEIDIEDYVVNWVLAGKTAKDVLGRALVCVLSVHGAFEPVAKSKQHWGSVTVPEQVREVLDKELFKHIPPTMKELLTSGRTAAEEE